VDGRWCVWVHTSDSGLRIIGARPGKEVSIMGSRGFALEMMHTQTEDVEG
jgi:hypothetical protein